jgi:hypothetical protein
MESSKSSLTVIEVEKVMSLSTMLFECSRGCGKRVHDVVESESSVSFS